MTQVPPGGPSTLTEWAAHVAGCPICGPIRDGAERRLRARRELAAATALKGGTTRAAAVAAAGGRDTARILAARARREAVRAHPNYRGRKDD